MAGVNILHVPFKGGGPAMIDVIGGHTKVMFSSLVQTTPHIKSGKLRALAGWGDRRVAAMPDVPTFKELGYPDAEFYIWAGLFAPRGTPEPVLQKLRDAVRAAVADADFKAAMEKLETPVVFKQGDEFQKFFEADARRLAEGVRKVGRIETK
jgi:tripartite-type tricarboxylate transporter receptor subunit TctC